MARSPVTAMVQQFNALSDVEQNVFLDLVDPQPEPEPQVKQTRKKRTTKSPKAQSLSSAITSSLEAKADAPQVFNGAPCKANVPGLDVECGEPEDNRIHDITAGYASYHTYSSSAPVAEKKSRRRGAAANNTQNTETNSEAAMSASGD